MMQENKHSSVDRFCYSDPFPTLQSPHKSTILHPKYNISLLKVHLFPPLILHPDLNQLLSFLQTKSYSELALSFNGSTKTYTFVWNLFFSSTLNRRISNIFMAPGNVSRLLTSSQLGLRSSRASDFPLFHLCGHLWADHSREPGYHHPYLCGLPTTNPHVLLSLTPGCHQLWQLHCHCP